MSAMVQVDQSCQTDRVEVKDDFVACDMKSDSCRLQCSNQLLKVTKREQSSAEDETEG